MEALEVLRKLRAAEKAHNEAEFQHYIARNGKRHKEAKRLWDIAFDLRQEMNRVREEVDAFLETQA